MQWNSPRFSEIHHWIIIIEPFPLQFKCESTTESGEFNTITEEEDWEEKGKKFKGFEPVKKKKRITDLFSKFKPQNQQTESNLKNSWRFRFESPNKTQVNTETYLFHTHKHQQIQIDVDP